MGEVVRVEKGGGIATIRIDRPKMNAINIEILDGILEASEAIAADSDVRAVVVWGGPHIFAAGADITAFSVLEPAAAKSLSREILLLDKSERPEFTVSAEGARKLSRKFNDAFLAIENLPQISVSAVNGFALGGGMELAMATDFRVAASNAVLGQPEILLGLIPGGGGTQRLPRLVGITKAKEIIYSGRNVYAEEAKEIGLVSSVHPPERTYDAAVEMAAGFASGPAALRMAKRAIMDGMELPLASALEFEIEDFGACFDTDDVTIGVASFLNRGPGKAVFTGH